MPDAIACAACGSAITNPRRKKYCGNCHCTAEGCNRPIKKHGMCANHWEQERYARTRPKSLSVRPKCEECGAAFDAIGPNKTRQKYCSPKCRNAAYARTGVFLKAREATKERRRALRETDPERWEQERRRKSEARKRLYPHECAWCGREFMGRSDVRTTCSDKCASASRKHTTHGPQSSAWLPPSRRLPMLWNPPFELATTPEPEPVALLFVAGTCGYCGDAFVTVKRGDWSFPGPWCSDRCQRRIGSQRRRARKQRAYVEPVNPKRVFKRDRYRCHICHKRLAMTKSVPHPKAPTIDHLIPLAAGGTHEMSNVAAAHFICNSGKRDRQANDQLLLVGW